MVRAARAVVISLRTVYEPTSGLFVGTPIALGSWFLEDLTADFNGLYANGSRR